MNLLTAVARLTLESLISTRINTGEGHRANFRYSISILVLFQNGGAKDGLDMNIGPAWQKGYTGKGVVVSILDDGIQTNHPDLAQNYVSEHFFNYHI